MKNKLLAVLVSAVIAFGLWLYVITVVSPESEQTYYDIPVVLQNKDVLNERGLMIVGEAPTVTLVLKGNRTILNELNEIVGLHEVKNYVLSLKDHFRIQKLASRNF